MFFNRINCRLFVFLLVAAPICGCSSSPFFDIYEDALDPATSGLSRSPDENVVSVREIRQYYKDLKIRRQNWMIEEMNQRVFNKHPPGSDFSKLIDLLEGEGFSCNENHFEKTVKCVFSETGPNGNQFLLRSPLERYVEWTVEIRKRNLKAIENIVVKLDAGMKKPDEDSS